MKNKSALIYVATIICVISLTLLNYYFNYVAKDNNPPKFDIIQRYNSLQLSRMVQGKTFRNFSCIEVNSNIRKNLELKNASLIILLSKLGCSICQNREVNFIKQFKAHSDLNIMYLCKLSDKYTFLTLDRALDINFPAYFLNDKDFDKLSLSQIYPQILFLQNNQVVSALFPIPGDDDFSQNFYISIKRFLVE